MKENLWHKTMYDTWFANSTLNSSAYLEKAVTEAQLILKQTKLKKDGRILDVPCGTGRHAIQFARAGFSVTGLEISQDCLRIANFKNSHKNISYELGDMKNLFHYHEKFDLVTNLYTSFGYFSTDKENEDVLRQIYSTLKPGGKICLNTVNRDWLMSIFSANDWTETDHEFILNKRNYDPKTKYNEARMVVIDKAKLTQKEYFHRIRLYSKPELEKLLKRVGFKKIKVLGDARGSKFSKLKSTHPYYFAEK